MQGLLKRSTGLRTSKNFLFYENLCLISKMLAEVMCRSKRCCVSLRKVLD